MVSREDLDNFDDSIDRRRRSAPSQPQRGSAAPRRNPPQPHRSGSQPQQRRPRPNNGASGRPVYRNASARRRREAQRKRRLRNRAIILGIGAALLILIIVLFSLMIRGCSSGSGSKEKVSTDTIQQQGGVTATPDEAANTGAVRRRRRALKDLRRHNQHLGGKAARHQGVRHDYSEPHRVRSARTP